MVKFAYLNDAFFEAFYLQASPLEGQSVQQIMKRKVEKGKAKQVIKTKNKKKNKSLTWKDAGHFLVSKF